jgi:hypothetical protein
MLLSICPACLWLYVWFPALRVPREAGPGEECNRDNGDGLAGPLDIWVRREIPVVGVPLVGERPDPPIVGVDMLDDELIERSGPWE